MPRHADPEVEWRVLDAAQSLWRGGGDKTLSMRALARAARTNTPAIYRRFKSRPGILRALVLRPRKELYEVVGTSASLEKGLERHLHFALTRPQEYQLYHAHYHELLGASPAANKAEEFGPSGRSASWPSESKATMNNTCGGRWPYGRWPMGRRCP